MRHPQQRQAETGCFAPRRPTSTQTKSLRLQRPAPHGAGPSARAAAADAAVAPAPTPCADNGSRRGSRSAGTCPAAPAPRERCVLPYAPVASTGVAVRLRNGGLARAARTDNTTVTPASDEAEGQAPSASPRPAPPRRAAGRGLSFVELLLQHTLSVERQGLREVDVTVAGQVLHILRQRRRQRKGARPQPAAWRRASATGGPQGAMPAEQEATVAALVTACEAATPDAALALLLDAYDTAASATTTATPSCLVATAIVELRCAYQPPTPADLELLDTAAASGHPGAMLRVGLCLRDGCGAAVPADLATALTYMEAAAGTGYVPAMHELALLYESGCVAGRAKLEPDWGEAVRWYRRAAASGHVPSQLNLGKLLLATVGREGVDAWASALELAELRQHSREWLTQAAQGGCEEASRLLQRL